jgi:hypothetical protein
VRGYAFPAIVKFFEIDGAISHHALPGTRKRDRHQVRAHVRSGFNNLSWAARIIGFQSFSSLPTRVMICKDGRRRRALWLFCASLSANKRLSAQSRRYCGRAVGMKMNTATLNKTPDGSGRVREWKNGSGVLIVALCRQLNPRESGRLRFKYSVSTNLSQWIALQSTN